MGSHAASTLGSLLLAATALYGCAAVAVPVLGSAAASGSAGALVHAGECLACGARYSTTETIRGLDDRMWTEWAGYSEGAAHA
jgi:hypothetical protein